MPLRSRSKLKQNRLQFAKNRQNDLQDDSTFAVKVCSSSDKHLRNCVILLRWALARETGICPEKIHADDATNVLAKMIGDIHWIGYWFASQAIDGEFYEAIRVDVSSANPGFESWSWNWETVAKENEFLPEPGSDLKVKDWIRPVAELISDKCPNLIAIEKTIEVYETHVGRLLL